MTVSIVLSDFVTEQTSASHGSPQQQGKLQNLTALAETSSAATDNCVMVFGKIPVDANITSIRFASDDSGDTGTANVGFYPGNLPASTLVHSDAVDEDAIGTAIDVNTAAVALTEIRYETKGIATTGQKAWELAGLSSRPDYDSFWVAVTTAAAYTEANVTTVLIVDYVA